METVTLRITGITCDWRAQTVGGALSAVSGVFGAHVFLIRQ